jgi:hypothetical protein
MNIDDDIDPRAGYPLIDNLMADDNANDSLLELYERACDDAPYDERSAS